MGLFSQAAFYTTVNHIKDLPQHGGREVAFVGRSNAGKSSAINTLANHVRLAYTSKTPGRTQHLNYFSLGNDNFLVDLPGYGYAKVPPDVQRHWEHLLSEYLKTREELETRLEKNTRELEGQSVPYPEFWGGYSVQPRAIEFWQGRRNRLHDRLVYQRNDRQWQVLRLEP